MSPVSSCHCGDLTTRAGMQWIWLDAPFKSRRLDKIALGVSIDAGKLAV